MRNALDVELLHELVAHIPHDGSPGVVGLHQQASGAQRQCQHASLSRRWTFIVGLDLLGVDIDRRYGAPSQGAHLR